MSYRYGTNMYGRNNDNGGTYYSAPPRTAQWQSYESGGNDNDVKIIAVIGPTGSGKTSFINAATGGQLRTSNGIQSTTAVVEPLDFVYKGQNVVLIDTPGFDDINVSDTEILANIADWLQVTYNNETQLSGLLYLHRITDIRVGGVSYKNMKLFRKICGLQNVLLCTTMWDRIDASIGTAREQQLQSDFWNNMIVNGASTVRHDGNQQTAQAIMDRLLMMG